MMMNLRQVKLWLKLQLETVEVNCRVKKYLEMNQCGILQFAVESSRIHFMFSGCSTSHSHMGCVLHLHRPCEMLSSFQIRKTNNVFVPMGRLLILHSPGITCSESILNGFCSIASA